MFRLDHDRILQNNFEFTNHPLPSTTVNLIFSGRRTIKNKSNKDKLRAGVKTSAPYIIPRLKQPLNFKLIQGY
jgi:hypothetical protein